MIAMWVSISCPLQFTIAGSEIVLQEYLDQLLPKLLPLAFTLGIFACIKIVNDEIRKTALKFGCPEKCKLSIFSTVKAADKFIRKIDEGIRVMILCNSPVPILKMAKLGYKAPFVTVGNMSTKPGATQIRKTVFVSPEEKAAFVELVEMGIPIYSQMVPNEAREDIAELLRN